MWSFGLLVVFVGLLLWSWSPVAAIVVIVVGIAATVILAVIESALEDPSPRRSTGHGDDGWTHTQLD